MLKLICKIQIKCKDTTISFDYVNDIEVSTSLQNLTDTAKVKLPRKMQRDGKLLTEYIGVDNKITIQTGYEGKNLKTIFEGYIIGIENGDLLTLKCENEMYKLKTINIPAQKIEQFDLKIFMKNYSPDTKVEIAEGIKFGSMNFETGMTMTQALDKIMQDYPYVKGYFQNNVFYTIFRTIEQAEENIIVFSPEQNMISDNLNYTVGKEVKIGIKATSILQDNSKLEAYAPKEAFTTDKGGKTTIKDGYEQKHLFCMQCTDLEGIQDFAEKTATGYVTDKMTGSFTTLGIPYVRKGDIIELRDESKPERNKKRFVAEAVEYSFGTGGYRQSITLGDRIKQQES